MKQPKSSILNSRILMTSFNKKQKVLITGTGRSGTHYTARLLQTLGLDVPHEQIGEHGTASWKHIRSGVFEVIGKNRTQHIDSHGFDQIIHQVRHPLKVIASMQTFSLSSWSYMAKFIDIDTEASPLMRGMQAWLRWNEMIEHEADWRFQIEQINNAFPRICEAFNIEPAEIPHLSEKQRDSRKNRYKPLSWANLENIDQGLTKLIMEKTSVYGYDTQEEIFEKKKDHITKYLKRLLPGH